MEKHGQGRSHRILDNPDLDMNARAFQIANVKLRKGGLNHADNVVESFGQDGYSRSLN